MTLKDKLLKELSHVISEVACNHVYNTVDYLKEALETAIQIRDEKTRETRNES